MGEIMVKKQKIFVGILGFVVSVSLGAGGMYLANYKKIDFMNRHTGFLRAENFVKDTLEIPVPESNTDNELNAYFKLYGDKYTRYGSDTDFRSNEYILSEVNDSSCAKLGGYRIRFNEDNKPYFSVVEEGMPADEAGIQTGDIIKNIDDFDISEPRLVQRLNGDDGTTAKLILERNGEEITINYRRHVNMNEDKNAAMEMYGNTLYADINSIDGYFETLLEDADEFDSIIFDLRHNGGGNPNTAVSMADDFIGESETILHAYNGDNQILKTDAEVKYDVPIVVIMDEKTASAAEILAALLKQYGDAELVGVNSFGKGIYQSSAMINGSPLIYTEGTVTVGDWECYQGVGIKPDVEIDMNPDYMNTDKDTQLQKALEIIEEKSGE